MSVQNVDSLAAQMSRKANDARRILDPTFALTAKAHHTLRFHVLPEPGRHRVERSEIHTVPAAVVPLGELREESARIAVLREVQEPEPVILVHLGKDRRWYALG